MHRLTARFLLVFALLGTFLPLALAAAPAPPRACCIRKTHHCHESASPESSQLVITATSSCDHNCCHAATTSQWADPQPGMTASSAHIIDAHIADSKSRPPTTQLSASQSTRAPPQLPIA